MESADGLSERIGKLLYDAKSSDVTLVVEGERLPAHRLILSTSSDYFRALLCGDMKESFLDEVVLKGVRLNGFKELMSFIYTGKLELENVDESTLLDFLQTAHIYGFESVQIAICRHLRGILSAQNVCKIFSRALRLKLKDVTDACSDLLETIPEEILATEGFRHLPAAAICHILSQDTFCAKEIDIFKAVERWCAERPTYETDISEVLATVRLPLIATSDLVTTVRNSGLITAYRLWEALDMKKTRVSALKLRGRLVRDENLATPARGVLCLTRRSGNDIVVAPEPRHVYNTSTVKSLWSEFCIDAGQESIIDLGEPFLINDMTFELSDPCSYSLEISVDLKTWVKVIDYSNYTCRSAQGLTFETRIGRYIRISAAKVPETTSLHMYDFAVSYETKPVRTANDFCVPHWNVASESEGAIVVNGWNESGECISGEFPEEYFGTGWSSHNIEDPDDNIVIQLPQPFMIDSMRMFLWDVESEGFSYYIETSVDWENWSRVVDRTSDFYRSWQILRFEPRPVLIIKIVGTAAKGLKEFACALFTCTALMKNLDECPAMNLGAFNLSAEGIRESKLLWSRIRNGI